MPDAVLSVHALAVDCADPQTLARFWQRMLGGEIILDPDGDAELAGGPVPLDFLRVPEGKTIKNRLHLDLDCDDYDAAIQHARRAGATLADDVYDGGKWQVLRDPEGNEFCILRPAC